MSMQKINQSMLTQPTPIQMYNLNAMVPLPNNQPGMAYPPQNYFGHQSIATPGFITNNFPSSASAMPNEPSTRRKSIIENINPLVGNEQKMLPMDLSMFPVRDFVFCVFFCVFR